MTLPKAGILLVTDYGSTLDRMIALMLKKRQKVERTIRDTCRIYRNEEK